MNTAHSSGKNWTDWERREKYALGEELEKALGLNQKLTAQVNMDFTDSSILSSMQGGRGDQSPLQSPCQSP